MCVSLFAHFLMGMEKPHFPSHFPFFVENGMGPRCEKVMENGKFCLMGIRLSNFGPILTIFQQNRSKMRQKSKKVAQARFAHLRKLRLEPNLISEASVQYTICYYQRIRELKLFYLSFLHS